MAYDSVRAQLDKLLGPDRNGPLTDSAAHSAPHYTDPSVCKHYLLGFCPNDLYIKHRSEPGSCRDLHSDVSKLAFEKDLAAGKVKREKALWARALLKECRSIVMDEDRKIRGHARRLQDTYRAQGDLTSLMIRNFDTLKKLGMVSQNAKIKVGNEGDDDDFFDEQGDSFEKDQRTDDNIEQSDHQSAQKASEGQSTGVTLDNDENADGFGIVKVIPGDADAEDGAEIDEFGRVKKAAPDNNKSADLPNLTKHESDDNSSEGNARARKSSQKENGNDSEDSDDGFGVVKVIPYDSDDGETIEKGDSATKVDKKEGNDDDKQGQTFNTEDKNSSEKNDENRVKEKLKSGQNIAQDVGNDEGNTENAKSAEQEMAVAVEVTGKATKRVSNNERNENDDNAGAKLAPSAEEIMDKFYEAGEGPDGLVMLDRKQSLRVCSCCGGYISLVDAESRLLSHFGGKSHHSLAVLRDKVVELERTVPELESQLEMGLDERGGRYRDDRDYHSVRSEHNRRDRRDYGIDRPNWMRRDGEHGRDRRRDGEPHGPYGEEPRWYGRSYDRHDRGQDREHERHRRNRNEHDGFGGDYYGRRGGQQERGYTRDRYTESGRAMDDSRRGRRDSRYDGARKRRRSSSPHRNHRRSRRH